MRKTRGLEGCLITEGVRMCLLIRWSYVSLNLILFDDATLFIQQNTIENDEP